MEGKAKAEQDSLTQVEEEDTSVQAYCADSCRQRMRADKGSRQCTSEKNQGGTENAIETFSSGNNNGLPNRCAGHAGGGGRVVTHIALGA